MTQNRMPTRRCTRAKIPCQQINNLFCQAQSVLIHQIPDNIYKKLPSTKKISCQNIQKLIQFLPVKSKQQNLKEMKQNVQIQYQQIMKLFEQQQEPENGNQQNRLKDEEKRQNDIKMFESIRKKKVKIDHQTCQVSDYDSQSKKDQNIFINQKIIERLEDYLMID